MAATSQSVKQLIKKFGGLRLDIGCGHRKHKGFVGMDKVPHKDVDLVHDFETFPWPLPDNCVHTVVMAHVWEHIKPWHTVDFMNELHRVCQHQAELFLSCPYGLSYGFLQDPTHCNPSVEGTFYYFDPRQELYQVYTPKPWYVMRFDRVPSGIYTDINAVLVCSKEPAKDDKTRRMRRLSKTSHAK